MSMTIISMYTKRIQRPERWKRFVDAAMRRDQCWSVLKFWTTRSTYSTRNIESMTVSILIYNKFNTFFHNVDHDISNCVLHVMDVASKLQNIELNEELIDADIENV